MTLNYAKTFFFQRFNLYEIDAKNFISPILPKKNM